MNTKSQLQELFRKKGINAETIRYNDSLDFYQINVGLENTDERFLADVHELGSSEAVDSKVDTDALRNARKSIDGSEIDAGTVIVANTM